MSNKDNKLSIPNHYSPQDVEERIYKTWEAERCFSPSNNKSFTFSVLLPPPNVTGFLHLGHALNHTIQDCLVRWKKMSGFSTIWWPGTDHAGIATQIQVEKHLAKENKKKEDLGREEFINRTWEWKRQYGEKIIHQMKRLGDSCDWSEHLFTLDPSSVAAVKKTFVHFYKKKWIYKGTRLVNWSPKLASAVSDLEVEYRTVKSSLWKIKYYLEDSKEYLEVATTRPETLLGDQAVAVHPEDERYKKYIGKKVRLPLVGTLLPVIADSYVDLEFGTGALKITPAHDFNDYKIGKKYNLKELNILNKNGTLNKEAGVYKGLSVHEARKKIVEDLKKQDLLVDIEPYFHQVAFCSRSGGVIEPFLSQQWFLKMDDLAKRALKSVENDEVELIPNQWKKTFKHWMEKLDDWCISRQLWWGHSIPAWYCEDCNQISVSEDKITSCSHCSSKKLKQEEDVLDTWFSSALWPMSILRWPHTLDLKDHPFYPSSVLVTGPDILFFWVARMIMMSLEFQNIIPFKQVYLHGIVRDYQGRKMSKSLGNGEDPLDLIEEYGADSLRLSLLSSHAKGRDVRFSRSHIEVCRNFLNKLWNAYKLIQSFTAGSKYNSKDIKLSKVDQWIISKVQKAEIKVNKELKSFRFSSACLEAYQFAWMEFCDWYLEWVKPIMYGDNEEQKKSVCFTLHFVFNRLVLLLHPFIPFFTEELYQKLNTKQNSIMLDSYPDGNDKIFQHASEHVEVQLDFIRDIVSTIRQMRGENQMKPSQKIEAEVIIPTSFSSKSLLFKNSESVADWILSNKESIMFLCKLKSLKVASKLEEGFVASMPITSHPQLTTILHLEGIVDKETEKNRLSKKLRKLTSEMKQIRKQLGVDSFINNAPTEIVEDKKNRQTELDHLIQHLKISIDRLK